MIYFLAARNLKRGNVVESSKVVLGKELGLGPAGICTWAEMPGSERGLLSGHGLDLRDEVARVHHAVADGGHELLEGDESVGFTGMSLWVILTHRTPSVKVPMAAHSKCA